MKLIISIILALNTANATPIADPEIHKIIKGEILYAVWNGSHKVSEMRFDDSNNPTKNKKIIKNKPTWYIVIGGVKNINKEDIHKINTATSLDPLFPRFPDIDIFPEGALLISFPGDETLPIAIGRSIKIINIKFTVLEDSSAATTVDRIEINKK